MADPFTAALGIFEMFNIVGGIFGSGKASSEQKKAYRESKEAQIRAYQYNVGATEKEIEQVKYLGQETRADIRREGGATKRAQSAAMGASGAVIGTGSPLMTMTETAESIERDLLRMRRLEQMEVEKREAEIGFMESEIDILQKSLEGTPAQGTKFPTSRGETTIYGDTEEKKKKPYKVKTSRGETTVY